VESIFISELYREAIYIYIYILYGGVTYLYIINPRYLERNYLFIYQNRV